MRVRRIREYHAANPKIDFFVNGRYRNSTNYFSHCRDARDWFFNCILQPDERLHAASKKTFLIASVSKR
jgi:hypothetical protein